MISWAKCCIWDIVRRFFVDTDAQKIHDRVDSADTDKLLTNIKNLLTEINKKTAGINAGKMSRTWKNSGHGQDPEIHIQG